MQVSITPSVVLLSVSTQLWSARLIQTKKIASQINLSLWQVAVYCAHLRQKFIILYAVLNVKSQAER